MDMRSVEDAVAQEFGKNFSEGFMQIDKVEAVFKELDTPADLEPLTESLKTASELIGRTAFNTAVLFAQAILYSICDAKVAEHELEELRQFMCLFETGLSAIAERFSAGHEAEGRL